MRVHFGAYKAKPYLPGPTKKQAGKRFLDVIMAKDVGRHPLEDLLPDICLGGKFLETLLLVHAAIKAWSSRVSSQLWEVQRNSGRSFTA